MVCSTSNGAVAKLLLLQNCGKTAVDNSVSKIFAQFETPDLWQ